MLNMIFKSKSAAREAERAQALNAALAIVSLEGTEGWKHYVKAAESLIESMTPNISAFDEHNATIIASQIAFISGIKRCLGLMQQQKDIMVSLKKPEDN